MFKVWFQNRRAKWRKQEKLAVKHHHQFLQHHHHHQHHQPIHVVSTTSDDDQHPHTTHSDISQAAVSTSSLTPNMDDLNQSQTGHVPTSLNKEEETLLCSPAEDRPLSSLSPPRRLSCSSPNSSATLLGEFYQCISVHNPY